MAILVPLESPECGLSGNVQYDPVASKLWELGANF